MFPVDGFSFIWQGKRVTRGLKMLLLLPFLLSCWIVSGLKREEPRVQYHGLRNRSVCLHVKNNLTMVDQGHWQFNDIKIAGTSIANPVYEKKAVFSRENFSLCINKLQDSDAGEYKVSITDSNFKIRNEFHQLTVQGMVPRPVMAVHPSNLSAGPCRFTVNCSIHDEWATSHCDAGGCNTSRTSTNKFNLSVFTERRAAVCRGNNHVSTNHASESIDFCFVESNVEHKEKPHKQLMFIVIIMVCSVLFVFAVVLAQRLHNRCPTPSARLIQSQPVETPSQGEPRASTSSSCQAEPSYENLEQPQVTGGAAQQPGSLESPTADTIYSYPGVTASARESNGSKDTGGQESVPSGSRPATGHETPQRSEVDTVYCLLQRPGNVK